MKGPQRPPSMEATVVDDAQSRARHDEEMARLKKQRDHQIWNVVVGIALMFAGTLLWVLAVGGMFMVVFGAVSYFYWHRRVTRLDDPWKDPEIDAWEEEHFGRM